MGKAGLFGVYGRRSPGVEGTASLEATKAGKNRWAFDVDLYNIKSNFDKHWKEVRFNSSNKATTHPADVARALVERKIISGVTTQ